MGKNLVIIFFLIPFLIFSKGDKFENILSPYKKEIKQGEDIIFVIKHKYKLLFYQKGKLKKTYEIGLSQSPKGDKKKQGDNKVPEGRYFIIQKAVGPFPGKYGAYLGKRWMRISYPNIKDAKRGLKAGLINKEEYNQIVKATKLKKEPPKTTKLGGGIGIHGWVINDWDNKGDRDLTWGCIVMHNQDIAQFYKMVKIDTKIIILK